MNNYSSTKVSISPTAQAFKWLYENKRNHEDLVAINAEISHKVDTNINNSIDVPQEIAALNDLVLRYKLNIVNSKLDIQQLESTHTDLAPLNNLSTKYEVNVEALRSKVENNMYPKAELEQKDIGPQGNRTYFRHIAGADEKMSRAELLAEVKGLQYFSDYKEVFQRRGQQVFIAGLKAARDTLFINLGVILALEIIAFLTGLGAGAATVFVLFFITSWSVPLIAIIGASVHYFKTIDYDIPKEMLINQSPLETWLKQTP